MKFLLFCITIAISFSLAACSEHSHDDGSHKHEKPSQHETIE